METALIGTNGVSQTQQASNNAPVGQTTQNNSGVISSDFETFLTMLTTQMVNQDPLDPTDSTEFAAQLAQFSMVEQQTLTNNLMQDLLAALTKSQMAANLAGYIGLDALSAAPVFFQGAPVTIQPNLPPNADSASILVYDAQDTLIHSAPLPIGHDTWSWDGSGADGSTLPHGHYTFKIETQKDGEVVSLEPAQAYGRIRETRMEGDKTFLILDGGQRLALDQLAGLRTPQA